MRNRKLESHARTIGRCARATRRWANGINTHTDMAGELHKITRDQVRLRGYFAALRYQTGNR